MEAQKERKTQLHRRSITSSMRPPARIVLPPPIALTSVINLVHLQNQLEKYSKAISSFKNTQNGTKIVTGEITDYSINRTHFGSKKTIIFLSVLS
jgi:hypothetical protein